MQYVLQSGIIRGRLCARWYCLVVSELLRKAAAAALENKQRSRGWSYKNIIYLAAL